jgi:hypothetical protein
MQDLEPVLLTIKIVGSWNTSIFKPEWINNFLFDNKDLNKKIGILIDFDENEIGYELDNLKLLPKSNELAIVIEKDKISEKSIYLATEVFIRILSLLPHTPIKGIGFNVDYLISQNSDLEILKWINNCKCDFLDMNLSRIYFSKTTAEYLLNLIFLKENDNLKINFNYHYPNLRKFDSKIFKYLINDSLNYLK